MLGQTLNRRRDGFTLIEIMIVVLIIGVLLAIAMPGFAKARDITRTRACIKNLRLIEQAKVQAAMDRNIGEGQAVGFDILVPDYLKSQPVCAAGGTYDCKTLGADATCTVTGHSQ